MYVVASLNILSAHSHSCGTYEEWGGALAFRSKTCCPDLSPLMIKEAGKKYYQAIVHQEDALVGSKPPQDQQDENDSSDMELPYSKEMAEYELTMEYYKEWKKKELGSARMLFAYNVYRSRRAKTTTIVLQEAI